jgi:hypothetical protein
MSPRRIASASLLIIACIAISCSGPPAPTTAPVATEQDTSKDLTKEKPEDLLKVKPDFTVTAADLFAEFIKDPDSAKKRYNKKIIEVSGEVGGFKYGDNAHGVVLRVQKQHTGFVCNTIDREPWARVCHGQEVKIRGRWSEGKYEPPELIEAVFVERPSRPQVVTAEQLIKELRTDPTATRQKYQGFHLTVEGKIQATNINQDRNYEIELSGDGKYKVIGEFDFIQKDVFETLKVGKDVKFYGEFRHLRGGDKNNELRFADSLLITGDVK